MKELVKQAIELCRGLHCLDCPLRDLACVVQVAQLEEEMIEDWCMNGGEGQLYLTNLESMKEKTFCCKCGKNITDEKQIGAGDGQGNRFQCEDCYKKIKKVKT